MSSREQCQQLLETIDAVLEECGKDPRVRRPGRPPSRPSWSGPSWLQGRWANDDGIDHPVHHPRS